jgi:ubiquinone/menaquinone biosynthesis C-methylase UbiE
MSESNWTPAEVAEMYDEGSAVSDLLTDGYEHLGYWYDEHDDMSVPDAAGRLTRKVVEPLALRRGEHVLDAGCGLGTSGVQLGNEFGVRVTGVTISPVEAGRAAARANAAGVSDLVSFEVGDFHALSFPEHHFDAVVAMESLMHATDLQKALLELHRVLRPGGRVAISEMTLASAMERGPMDRSRVPMTADRWIQEVATAGFVIEEWTVCGRRVFGGSSRRFLDNTRTFRDEIVAEFNEEFFDAVMAAQDEAFGAGAEHMSYVIICASKPAE